MYLITLDTCLIFAFYFWLPILCVVNTYFFGKVFPEILEQIPKIPQGSFETLKDLFKFLGKRKILKELKYLEEYSRDMKILA